MIHFPKQPFSFKEISQTEEQMLFIELKTRISTGDDKVSPKYNNTSNECNKG